MTMRGFLAYYLGTVMVIGAAGASTYHVLVLRHAVTEAAATPAKPVVVAETAPQDAAPPTPAPAATVPLPEPLHVRLVPKLRPHVATAGRPIPRHPLRTVSAEHSAAHRPTAVAALRREVPVYRPAPYMAPPRLAPPAVGYYAYPAYSPYAGYYTYYPRYGYYRSF
jgi:hypothetical protein